MGAFSNLDYGELGNIFNCDRSAFAVDCGLMRENDMDEYITPNYETISTKQKRDLMELMQSSLLNAFAEEDYNDILKVFQRVIERLESIEEGE